MRRSHNDGLRLERGYLLCHLVVCIDGCLDARLLAAPNSGDDERGMRDDECCLECHGNLLARVDVIILARG